MTEEELFKKLKSKMGYKDEDFKCEHCKHFVPQHAAALPAMASPICILNPAVNIPVHAEGICTYFEDT